MQTQNRRPVLKLEVNQQRPSGTVNKVNQPNKSGGTTEVVIAYNSVDIILNSEDCIKKRSGEGPDGKPQYRIPEYRGKPSPSWTMKLFPSMEEVIYFDKTSIKPGDSLPHLYRQMRDAIKVAITNPQTGKPDWENARTILRSKIFRIEKVPLSAKRTTIQFKYVGDVPAPKANVFQNLKQEKTSSILSLTPDEGALIAAFNEAIGNNADIEVDAETITESLVSGISINGKHVSMSPDRATTVASNPSAYGIGR